jgi:hypothetical protein
MRNVKDHTTKWGGRIYGNLNLDVKLNKKEKNVRAEFN